MSEQRNGKVPGSATDTAEPSLGELVAAASRDASTLIRSEIDLAKAEISAEVKKAAMGGAMFGAAAVLGLYALILFSFGATHGLDKSELPLWASFLIIGGIYLLIAGLLAAIGAGAVKKLGPPKKTIKTAKETVAALKDRGNSPAKA